jgi:D-alanine-D-alanine ligase
MQTVAVIFGGRSAEHDVSIVTAISSIIKPLELSGKYNVLPIYIAKNGAWYSDKKLKNIALFTTGNIDDFIISTQPLSVQFDGGMTAIQNTGLRRVSKKIDIVFPSMHGTYGEDGSLMGLLEMAGVPYVGAGLSASVLSMDKVLAKQIVSQNGIDTAKYVWFTNDTIKNNIKDTISTIESNLDYPVFVKPAHLGSSIGITRAMDRKTLENALEVAAHYDDKVLIEEEVKNLIEVTLPILGNVELTPSLLERPLTSSEDFFDFDTKYMQGGKKGGGKKGNLGAQGYSEVPAKLPKDLYKKAEKTGLDVYRVLGCSGTSRIDMLINEKTHTVYFNEVNPLPGDLYAHNWRASGLSSVELIEKLVDLAIERYAKRQKLNTAFTTNYLKQF